MVYKCYIYNFRICYSAAIDTDFAISGKKLQQLIVKRLPSSLRDCALCMLGDLTLEKQFLHHLWPKKIYLGNELTRGRVVVL